MGCCGGGHQLDNRELNSDNPFDPVEILRVRLISGEFTVDEYKRALKALNLEEQPHAHSGHAMKTE